MPEEIKLSDKHMLFVHEYVNNNCNSYKAYRAVYPDSSEAACRSSASELLTNPKIKAAIDIEIDKLLNDKRALSLQIMNEYRKIAFSDIKTIIDPATGKSKIDDNTDTSILESVQFDFEMVPTSDGNKKKAVEKVKYKLYNKQTALDALSKYFAQLSEKKELKIEITNFSDWIKSVNAS